MEDLFDRILITSDELKASLTDDPEHPNFMSLRKLRHYCFRRLLESEDSYERFLSFLICSFVDEIFFNLLGDTPYDKDLHSARISLLEDIAKTFMHMGRKKELYAVFESFPELVSKYVDIINSLNRSEVL
ncbi:MAG: hypothetical protein M1508_14480 [Nitrospirae bacterium]|nr:hypothetical protein [Nitrospirota bacterium]MCL5421409.1 hypothetical protein [Nitrospirota bacterium]